MLEIKTFSKSYGKSKLAVDDLSLKVKSGEIYGFIGHNGAGKTTTIKAIAGVHTFDKGDILIDGLSIKENPIECKMKMAYIPDNPDLYEHLSGIDYLNFIMDIYKVTEDREQLVKKYGDLFEITANLADPISSYSHGMKQKLALISAFVHHPKLLILDEPFVGLDPKASFTLKQIMKELTDEGSTIFFSTHVLEVAEKLCDEIAIIKDGKLVKHGKMKEIVQDKSLEDIFMELVNHE